MPVYRISIAGRIREYRKTHRLSQSEFGELVGVSPQAVNKWKHDLCCPDIQLLPVIAEVLGCRVDDFFEKRREDAVGAEKQPAVDLLRRKNSV